MTKRLNIGIDVDGVLADFTTAARKVCQELFDGRPDDSLVQTTWAFESLGITKEEENILWKELDSRKNWWLESLYKLPNTNLLMPLYEKHRLIFITNRKDGKNPASWPIELQTAEWLRRQFHIYHPNVIISDNKGPLMDGLKLDYFIDDRPKNVQEAVEAIDPQHQATLPVLLAATYNRDYMYPYQVSSFNEFADVILNGNGEFKPVYQTDPESFQKSLQTNWSK
jgi:uncharacterized HAD superfamily protein